MLIAVITIHELLLLLLNVFRLLKFCKNSFRNEDIVFPINGCNYEYSFSRIVEYNCNHLITETW